MDTHIHSSLVTLERREVLLFPDGSGEVMTCAAGRVWITRHRSEADIVLMKGQSICLDGIGQLLVQGLARSAVRIAAAGI